ncbi:MAG: transposase [Thiohalomonadaceae bacterium]
MTNIRRHFILNAPVFITAVCHERGPWLAPSEHKDLLLQAMREVKERLPFRMLGYALLDDHFHWLFVPGRAADFPRIVQAVKLRFARRIAVESPVWQRRYWDHVIRSMDDLRNHLDYIHYNPVKHELASVPGDYPWSSLSAYVAKGWYPPDWCTMQAPEGVKDWHFE